MPSPWLLPRNKLPITARNALAYLALIAGDPPFTVACKLCFRLRFGDVLSFAPHLSAPDHHNSCFRPIVGPASVLTELIYTSHSTETIVRMLSARVAARQLVCISSISIAGAPLPRGVWCPQSLSPATYTDECFLDSPVWDSGPLLPSMTPPSRRRSK